jgi:hypothetical protein
MESIDEQQNESPAADNQSQISPISDVSQQEEKVENNLNNKIPFFVSRMPLMDGCGFSIGTESHGWHDIDLSLNVTQFGMVVAADGSFYIIGG